MYTGGPLGGGSKFGIVHMFRRLQIGYTQISSILATAIIALSASVCMADTATVEEVKSIARLYSAAFDRDPETSGLNFWVDSYEKGRALVDMANDFYRSPEFSSKYGPLDNGQYVERLYRNVLGRAGERSGVEFWLGHLNDGLSRAKVLAQFADSPENVQKTSETFADMRFVDGRWIFQEGITTNRALLAGLIESGSILLVDNLGIVIDAESAFGRSPDGDYDENGVAESYSFIFSNIAPNRKIRLYLIDETRIHTVFFTDHRGVKSNVFSLDEGVSIDVGLIGWEELDSSDATAQLDPFANAGVASHPAILTIPIGVEKPPVAGLGNPELLRAGMGALFSGWIGGANTYLGKVITTTSPGSSAEANAARFFGAFSKLAAFSSELISDGNPNTINRIGDVLDLMGVPDDVRRGSLNWIEVPDDWDRNAVSSEKLTDFIKVRGDSDLARAVTLLEQVKPGFRITWIRPDDSTPVENDYGDAQFILGVLRIDQAMAAINAAYNFEIDVKRLAETNTDDFPGNDQTVESILNQNPQLLSIKDRSRLAKSRELILRAIADFENALRVIESETDSQDDDLIRVSSLDADEIARTRSYLAGVKKSLTGGGFFNAADTDGEKRKDLILDLQAFFTVGVDFRKDNLVPAVIGNELDDSEPCLPDPTFNGVVISLDISDDLRCN
jgi:hypothetical protein